MDTSVKCHNHISTCKIAVTNVVWKGYPTGQILLTAVTVYFVLMLGGWSTVTPACSSAHCCVCLLCPRLAAAAAAHYLPQSCSSTAVKLALVGYSTDIHSGVNVVAVQCKIWMNCSKFNGIISVQKGSFKLWFESILFHMCGGAFKNSRSSLVLMLGTV